MLFKLVRVARKLGKVIINVSVLLKFYYIMRTVGNIADVIQVACCDSEIL